MRFLRAASIFPVVGLDALRLVTHAEAKLRPLNDAKSASRVSSRQKRHPRLARRLFHKRKFYSQ